MSYVAKTKVMISFVFAYANIRFSHDAARLILAQASVLEACNPNQLNQPVDTLKDVTF